MLKQALDRSFAARLGASSHFAAKFRRESDSGSDHRSRKMIVPRSRSLNLFYHLERCRSASDHRDRLTLIRTSWILSRAKIHVSTMIHVEKVGCAQENQTANWIARYDHHRWNDVDATGCTMRSLGLPRCE